MNNNNALQAILSSALLSLTQGDMDNPYREMVFCDECDTVLTAELPGTSKYTQMVHDTPTTTTTVLAVRMGFRVIKASTCSCGKHLEKDYEGPVHGGTEWEFCLLSTVAK